MYTRATRRTSFHKENTPNVVAPGAYVKTADEYEEPGRFVSSFGGRKISPGFAGFGATESRKLDPKDKSARQKNIPGPGSYLQRDFVEKSKNPRSNVFKSRVARLAPQTVGSTAFVEGMAKANPGPGSYKAASDFDAAQHRRSSQRSHTSLGISGQNLSLDVKTPSRPHNPPAIPRPAHGPSTLHQSYGYEETPDGRMAPLSAPTTVHTGEKGDTIGPGQYELPGPFQMQTGLRMDGYAKRKPVFAPKEGTAPGQYEPKEVRYIREKAKKMTPAFASDTPMCHNRPVDPLREHLGPGAYIQRPLIDQPESETPPAPQHFGTTQQRLGWLRHESSPFNDIIDRNPAPGTYGLYSSFKKNEQKRLTEDVVGFGQTTERPCLSKTKAGPPGPGDYSTENFSIASTVQKKVIGRNGVFGTTSSRFNTDSKGNLITTGSLNQSGTLNTVHAETYEPPRGTPMRQERKYTRPRQQLSNFKSLTKRFGQVASNKQDMHIIGSDTIPPVGVYNVENAFKFAKDARADTLNPSSVQNSFLAKSKRFEANKTFDLKQINQVPGPGSYNPSARKVGKRVTKPVIGKTLRFDDPGRHMAHLGPGSYVSTENSLLQKSYNITFSDKKQLPPPESVDLGIVGSRSEETVNRSSTH